MNFHICATDPLAAQAAVEVRELLAQDSDAVVCIRGEITDEGERVYTVAVAPRDWNRGGYLWEYVSAAEWLREYEALGR